MTQSTSTPAPVASGFDPLAEVMGAQCYSAYADSCGWRYASGAKLPDFYGLPRAERQHWLAVGQAAVSILGPELDS